MRNLLNTTIICLFLLFTASNLLGQAEVKKDSLFLIETKDGNDYIGTIVTEDSISLTLSTAQLGVIVIPQYTISRRSYIPEQRIKGNEAWLDNPQAARYFYAPNGYGLHTGEWYYQNIWVLFNQISVGLGENFSIGVGMVPLFFFAGAPSPIWITPKMSIPVVKDKFNVGIGALAGTILDVSGSGEGGEGFGIIYGMGTVGSKDINASLGIGYGYIDGELAEYPAINFSALIRGGRNFYLVTENYLFVGDEVGAIAAGGRSMIRNASIDYGLVIPVNTGEVFAVPWLGFAVPFYSRDHESK